MVRKNKKKNREAIQQEIDVDRLIENDDRRHSFNELERKAPRSQGYQHLIVESLASHDMLESFSNDDSLQKRLNPFSYNEEIFELEEALRIRFWEIVQEKLTKRQREVLKLWASNYTQVEIAKILNVNQSSITKSLNGNVDYKKNKVTYGGSKRRLQKLIELDPKAQEILGRIRAIREDEW